jgi:hypothetical protein
LFSRLANGVRSMMPGRKVGTHRESTQGGD